MNQPITTHISVKETVVVIQRTWHYDSSNLIILLSSLSLSHYICHKYYWKHWQCLLIDDLDIWCTHSCNDFSILVHVTARPPMLLALFPVDCQCCRQTLYRLNVNTIYIYIAYIQVVTQICLFISNLRHTTVI